MNISIPKNVFKAGQHCMAVKDTRYYLNGVCLRIDNGIAGQAYATDGHILFACSFGIENNSDAVKGVFDILIPVDAVKHAAKSKNSLVELTSLDDGSYMLAGMRFIAIDGTFPDVARVIPEAAAISGEAGNYQAPLLARCDKALITWFDMRASANLKLHQNGSAKSALMQGPDNSAICVIMPYRPEETSPFNFKILETKPAG